MHPCSHDQLSAAQTVIRRRLRDQRSKRMGSVHRSHKQGDGEDEHVAGYTSSRRMGKNSGVFVHHKRLSMKSKVNNSHPLTIPNRVVLSNINGVQPSSVEGGNRVFKLFAERS